MYWEQSGSVNVYVLS